MQWFVAKLLLITIGNNIISLQIYCNDSDFLYIIGQYLVHTHLSQCHTGKTKFNGRIPFLNKGISVKKISC